MSDLVPEEAIEAAAAALESQQVDADDPHAWFRGHAEGVVRAAAPLILAAELVRLADEAGRTERSVRSFGVTDYSEGKADGVNWAAGMLRERASVLRGEGQTNG